MLIRYFLLMLLSIHFTAAAVILNDETVAYDNFTISYLHDEKSELSIQDVSHMEFKEHISNQFSKGYRSGNAWFKITLNNQSATKDFVLYFTEPLWRIFNLYKKQGKAWIEYKNGLDIALKDRMINDTLPAFALTIGKGESKTYYVKGETIASHIGEFKVMTHDEFFRPTRMSLNKFYIFYLGILFVILLFNIFLFIVIRERLYLYYIAYIISFVLFVGTLSGFYLSFDLPGWSEALHTVGTLVVIFMVLFSGVFLELKDRLPRMHLTFKLFTFIFMMFALAIAYDIPHSSLWFNIISSIFFTTLLVVAILVWKQGYVLARYYLAALVIYMVAMGLMTLTFNSVLENNDFTRYFFLVGAFVEIIFFSFILASRFHEVQRYKINIQRELIKEKEDNAEILSQKVGERTSALMTVIERLEVKAKELEETKKQLTIEATTDPLTGLFNRRHFSEVSSSSFNVAKRYKQELSIMMLDIDKFKNINDTYGHAIGDKVLISCAKVLMVEARDSDVVARYGGEEFIFLLPHTSLEETSSVAKRIQSELSKKVFFENMQEINVTLSIGIATYKPDMNMSLEGLIKQSDIQLYIAKDRGRNQIAFEITN